MAFFTIHEAPGLDPAARRRARASGPRALALRSPHRRMLATAGFVDVGEVDVSGEFLDTQRAWYAHSRRLAGELEPLFEPGVFEERMRERKAALAAIEEGILRRSLYAARRPERGLTAQAR